ncbi:sulfatase [Allomuricauda sp. SCSIO 65647]|uniref:sulfatase family protein n=1 Tax=Allomuricauda sp. SCSIO 65647 TaxID=2908843 RepID=UPI001F34DA80|nr:sulfatase [Muricauda sp. SCSIO 65647]UJH68640.1 sulfatase [Muricauda sp. SCSIO 65647]
MLRISLLSLIFVFLLSCQDEKKSSPKKQLPPNIVIIFTDDQGYQDVGVFGSPNIETPNLDQMAADGVKLTHYYAAQAVCSASRAALLTGCYPNRIGIHNALGPDNTHGINASETTLAEMLKAKGYKTAIYGKWHLGHHKKFLPTRHGFDEWFGIPYSNDMWPYHPQQGPIFNFPDLHLYENEAVIDTLVEQSQLTTQITARSVDFINRNKDQPFFLYVPHPQPHVPLFVSDKFKGKSERGLYGDVIMEIDWSVGEIMKALNKNGIEENTMVIFTSDNGPWLSYGNHAGSALPLREGKGTAWEGGQREPFLIKYPDSLPTGKTIDVPMMAIDLLPTIAEVTGAELPKKIIDGKSAWKLLKGESDKSPQEAYFFYYRVNELFGVRYGKWKLYFPHRYRTMNGQEPGKDGQPGHYRHIELDEIELYDLSTDVSETKNVAVENPEVVEKIRLLANDMRSRLGDSLLELEGAETREPGRLDETF